VWNHLPVTPSRSVKILDVARAAGVSTATVSRVLNGASTVDPPDSGPTLAALPVIALFLAFQRYIISGIRISGIE